MTESIARRPETRWDARYADELGEEPVVFTTDGTELRTIIRGVRLTGLSPDSLQAEDADQPEGARLKFRDGWLDGYLVEVDIPVVVALGSSESKAIVKVAWDLRGSAPTPGSGKPTLVLQGATRAFVIESDDATFESAIPKLERQLPAGSFVKSCLNCQYSDYGVGGSQEFGSLYCFRRLKTRYLAVRSKSDYLDLFDGSASIELTQETYLCPEFSRRTPGTGYRG
jgi:hypothetical protein